MFSVSSSASVFILPVILGIIQVTQNLPFSPLLNGQLSGVKHISSVVQLSISRSFLSSQTKILHPLNSNPPPSSLQSLTTCIPSSVCMTLPILGTFGIIQYFSFLCLAYFIMFSSFICVIASIRISFLLSWKNFPLWIYISYFVYPSICWWTDIRLISIFWLLWIMHLWTLVSKYLFESLLSFVHIPRHGISGSYWLVVS